MGRVISLLLVRGHRISSAAVLFQAVNPVDGVEQAQETGGGRTAQYR